MSTPGLKVAEIKKDIALLPEDKLDEVKDFISFVLSRDKEKKKKIVQMKGIWKGKGFEKLNIDKELKVARKEWAESILKKEI
ncbi:hypothetical protein D1AOALGA4SA_2356 [Olavius algarvensis Delta 1 endosymbiont]|nr:hypothetical protein D1AOALGA4SA_2356 [Olavius algarvensis Delta 1 endosymbiont]